MWYQMNWALLSPASHPLWVDAVVIPGFSFIECATFGIMQRELFLAKAPCVRLNARLRVSLQQLMKRVELKSLNTWNTVAQQKKNGQLQIALECYWKQQLMVRPTLLISTVLTNVQFRQYFLTDVYTKAYITEYHSSLADFRLYTIYCIYLM